MTGINTSLTAYKSFNVNSSRDVQFLNMPENSARDSNVKLPISTLVRAVQSSNIPTTLVIFVSAPLIFTD